MCLDTPRSWTKHSLFLSDGVPVLMQMVKYRVVIDATCDKQHKQFRQIQTDDVIEIFAIITYELS